MKNWPPSRWKVLNLITAEEKLIIMMDYPRVHLCSVNQTRHNKESDVARMVINPSLWDNCPSWVRVRKQQHQQQLLLENQEKLYGKWENFFTTNHVKMFTRIIDIIHKHIVQAIWSRNGAVFCCLVQTLIDWSLKISWKFWIFCYFNFIIFPKKMASATLF